MYVLIERLIDYIENLYIVFQSNHQRTKFITNNLN